MKPLRAAAPAALALALLQPLLVPAAAAAQNAQRISEDDRVLIDDEKPEPEPKPAPRRVGRAARMDYAPDPAHGVTGTPRTEPSKIPRARKPTTQQAREEAGPVVSSWLQKFPDHVWKTTDDAGHPRLLRLRRVKAENTLPVEGSPGLFAVPVLLTDLETGGKVRSVFTVTRLETGWTVRGQRVDGSAGAR